MSRKWITNKLSRREVLRLGATGAALGLGGLVLPQVARATDGVGITITTLAGPVAFDVIDSLSDIPDHRVRIRTEDTSDVYTVHVRIEPGGHSGWHSHPGPSFVSVISGEATFYEGDDLKHTPNVFAAGTGFVEDGGDVHINRNEGDTDLELIIMQIVPTGAPRRIDEPRPPHYDFG